MLHSEVYFLLFYVAMRLQWIDSCAGPGDEMPTSSFQKIRVAVCSQLSLYPFVIFTAIFQGLTFWDGRNRETKAPNEIHYETRSGDLAFIDR